MRLQWATRSPEHAAAQLGDALGVVAGSIDGHPAVRLGPAVLEFVALPPESPGDDRLVFARSDVPDGELPPNPGRAALACVGIGVATVDTDRMASQHRWRMSKARPDRVLGAHASVAASAEIAGVVLLVLEPDTEGRVAASLARWGEGPMALYLRPSAGIDAARAQALAGGGRVTATHAGPFGRSFAIAGGPPWGPHLVIVESDTLLPPGADAGPG